MERFYMIAQSFDVAEVVNQTSSILSFSPVANDVMNATFDDNSSLVSGLNTTTMTGGPGSVLVQFAVITTLSVSVAALNTLLIATVCRSKNLRTSVSNAFILNLSIVDITSAIFVLPMFAVTVILRFPPGSSSTCTAVGFITQTLLVESIITLALIGVDRYVNICHPLRYLHLVNKQTAIVFISLSWIYSLTIASAPLAGFGKYSFLGPEHLLICSVDYSTTNSTSSFQREYAALVLCAVVAPAVTAIAVVYARIFLAARMQNRRISDAGLPPLPSSSGPTTRPPVRQLEPQPTTTCGHFIAKPSSQVSSQPTANSGVPETKNAVIDGEAREAETSSDSNPPVPIRRGWKALRVGLKTGAVETAPNGKSPSVDYDGDGRWLNALSKIRKVMRQVRAARTVALIIGGFFLCWTPYTAVTITTVVTGSQPSNYDVNFAANFMAFTGGLVNPGVCLLVNREYWSSFRILVGLRRRELMRVAARAFAEAAAENSPSEYSQAGCRQRFMSIESGGSETSETSEWVIFRERWKQLQDSVSAG